MLVGSVLRNWTGTPQPSVCENSNAFAELRRIYVKDESTTWYAPDEAFAKLWCLNANSRLASLSPPLYQQPHISVHL